MGPLQPATTRGSPFHGRVAHTSCAHGADAGRFGALRPRIRCYVDAHLAPSEIYEHPFGEASRAATAACRRQKQRGEAHDD